MCLCEKWTALTCNKISKGKINSRREKWVCKPPRKTTPVIYLSASKREPKKQETRSSRKILKYSMRTVHNANSKKGFRYLVNNNFSGTPFLCVCLFLFRRTFFLLNLFLSLVSIHSKWKSQIFCYAKKKKQTLNRYKEVHRRVKL